MLPPLTLLTRKPRITGILIWCLIYDFGKRIRNKLSSPEQQKSQGGPSEVLSTDTAQCNFKQGTVT